MAISKSIELTKHKNINELLLEFSTKVDDVLGKKLLGLYLTGSLSYGDFNFDRSDIDLIAILQEPASVGEIKHLKKLHLEIEEKYKNWERRIECSYTPIEKFENVLPPKDPRPYFGEGKFYSKAPYGNEWLINKYLLYKHGITLLGPDIKNLIQPVNIEDVKKACIRDLHQEWESKISEPKYLENNHYQSYVVLNLCRILHTVIKSSMTTKSGAATWVKKKYSEWESLIEEAERWGYGKRINKQKDVINFIKFVLKEIAPFETRPIQPAKEP